MKYNIALYISFLISLVSCSRVFGPAVVPVSEQARLVTEISMQHTYLGGGSLQLFLLFEDRRKVMQVAKAATHLTYEVRSGTHEQDDLLLNDTLKLAASRMSDAEGGLYLNLTLPAELVKSPNVVHLQLWQQLGKDERMGSSFQIPLEIEMLDKRFALADAKTNRPIVRNYITTSDLLKVISTADSSSATAQLIDADFTPALPPMSGRAEQKSRTLAILDTLTLTARKTLTFDKEGLYLLWADESYKQGLLVQPWSYPRVTMARELIDPLIYLTTSQERKRLTNAPDPKKAVDLFWHQTAGNIEVARSLIKEFYGRVEDANKLFTSHKAGWATDRGMIYIVFGRPDEINRAGLNEVWIYKQTRTQPHIKFVFTKKQNNFTENHYELVRLRDYQEVWYSTVAKWRAGITEM